MLRGSYKSNIDEKGRLRIPAAFKRYLDEHYGETEYYVTSMDGESARVYPLKEWETIENKLALLPALDTTKRKFLDRTNYFGQPSSFDGQGRMLIHPLLRGQAELLGEVTVFGYLSYLEVWSTERFLKDRLHEQPFDDDDFEALARLGI